MNRFMNFFFQSPIRSFLPCGLVHPNPPQGRFHHVLGLYQPNARRVDSHQLASPAMGQGSHAYFKNEQFPTVPV